VTKRDAPSAKSRRLEGVKKTLKDLSRRYTELVNEQKRDWFLATPMGSPEASEYLDKLGEVTKQRVLLGIEREVLEGLPKPGPKPGTSKASAAIRAMAQACLDAAGGRSGPAKQGFINRLRADRRIGEDRADNLWYEVTLADGRTRRVR
jgi:hypothetical protein